MRLWILAKKPPSTEDAAYLIGRLAARSQHVFVTHVTETDRQPPEPPPGIEIIFNYSFNTSESYLHSLDALAADLGVTVINTGTATITACDKRGYIEHFSGMIPSTWVVGSLREILEVQGQVGDEIVLKDPFGKHGKKIMRFSGEADRDAAAALLESIPNRQLVAQVFCRGFVEGDKRIIVHNDPRNGVAVAAWFARTPAPGGWISNFRTGGRIHNCELAQDEIEMALRVAEISGLDYVGIDLGREAGCPLLIETNAYTGGHINFDIDHREHSGDALAQVVAALAANGRKSASGHKGR